MIQEKEPGRLKETRAVEQVLGTLMAFTTMRTIQITRAVVMVRVLLKAVVITPMIILMKLLYHTGIKRRDPALSTLSLLCTTQSHQQPQGPQHGAASLLAAVPQLSDPSCHYGKLSQAFYYQLLLVSLAVCLANAAFYVIYTFSARCEPS